MIITLCGSARFEREYKEWNLRLTMAGHTVFGLVQYPSDNSGNKDWYTPEQKEELDRAHFRKIDASGGILVLNRDDYIGYSTKREVEHAARWGKQILFLEPREGSLGVCQNPECPDPYQFPGARPCRECGRE